jgi:Papain-like cysteine protease AvrRpt2
VIAGLAAMPSPVPAVTSSNRLSIGAVSQSGVNWCWAACAEMAVNHSKGASTSQCDFANWLVPAASCCGLIPPSTTCDQPCAASQISSMYNNWKVKPTGMNASVTFATIRQEINASRPVQIGFQYGNGTGHTILVHGWVVGVAGNMLDIIDPNAARVSALYTDLQTAFGTGGVWDWTWVNLS